MINKTQIPLYLLVVLTAVLVITLCGCNGSSADTHNKHGIIAEDHENHNHGEENLDHQDNDDHANPDVHEYHDEHEEHDEPGESNDHDSHAEEMGIHLSQISIKEAGIRVEELTPRVLSSKLEFPGKVVPHPDEEGYVGGLIEGRVREIFVDVGDYINKGDPLCIVESPAIGEAESNYIVAKAELEFISSDLGRHRQLSAEGIGSQKEVLELEARLKSSSSLVSATERTLHAIGFNEDDIRKLDSESHTGGRVTLRSPLSGNVLERSISNGKMVTPELDLFHIVNLERMRVNLDVPEQRISEVKEGSSVKIVSQNGHQFLLNGHIDRLGKKIEEELRTLTAYVSVDNHDQILRPGAFVTVRVSLENDNKPVIAVPLDAIIKDEHGDRAVFVEEKPGTFVVREIESGLSVDGWTEIVAGISQGERVVTQGAFTIKSEAEKNKFGDGHNH